MTAIRARDQVRAKINIKDAEGTLRGTYGQHPGDWVTVGDSTLIDGINIALTGMNRGESKTVTLDPVEAYGELDPALLQRVALSELPKGIQKGDQFTDSRVAETHWIVTEIHKDFAILDANHPLAGQNIIVEIEIIEIKNTPEKGHST